MQDKQWTKLLAKVLLIVPLILGFLGLRAEGYAPLDALFTSVQMYALEYGDGNNSLPIEIARWTAPLATAGVVVFAVSVLRRKLRCLWVYHRGDSVAVYGSGPEKYAILRHLGTRAMDPGKKFVKAHTYILLGDEKENLSFYHLHQDELSGSMVYLKCSSLSAQSGAGENLRLYCPEEIAARMFWKRHSLYPQSRAAGHRMDVVFIGFGRLGEELLLSGLQRNIFHPDQHITYHIFGEDKGFTAIRPGLQQITDPVQFYDTPWYDSLGLIDSAAMVIVLDQDDQLSLLRQLTLACARSQFHVFSGASWCLDLMDQRPRLQVFDWQREAGEPDNLFRDALNQRAKRINLRYAHLNSGVAETEENMEREWKKLNVFTKYSNISAADYYEVLRDMLMADGLPTSYQELNEDQRELLAHLEHIRWCRYHYLNNWKYGVPSAGGRKDPALRIHADLKEYAHLTEEEKHKDRENISTLFSMKQEQ